jgi:hypothetical protein
MVFDEESTTRGICALGTEEGVHDLIREREREGGRRTERQRGMTVGTLVGSAMRPLTMSTSSATRQVMHSK